LLPFNKTIFFIIKTLSCLNEKLSKLDHDLLVLKGHTQNIVASLLASGKFSHLGITSYGGYNEIDQLTNLGRRFPDITRYNSC